MRTIILGLLIVIAFSACKQEKKCGGSMEKTFTVNNFNSVKGGGVFALNVQQGAAFSIKAKGCDADVNDLQLSVDNGGMLVVEYSRQADRREIVSLDITLPMLRRMVLDGAATGSLKGFNNQASDLRVILSGASKCTVDGLPALLNTNLSGAGELTVAGTSADLIAHLSGAAKMNAYAATFDDADVYTTGTASLRVQVRQDLVALASGDSRIYYKGNPPRVHAEQEGAGKVIRE